ncbi:hypothetical protein [Halovenus marina]|uniref:hypothetical protein n=1 Tax=Halovenus marina TaxID=3396621 RepID=UPI003F55B8E1
MASDIHLRVTALLALCLVGVSLGSSGVALGVGNTISGDNAGPTVSVTGDGISVSDGEENQTVVKNMSNVDSVEIVDQNGAVSVNTQRTSPLSESEQERAAEIARNNETVQQYLDSVTSYNLVVSPVRKLTADHSITIADFELTNATGETITGSFDTSNITFDKKKDSVILRRQPDYVKGVAQVEVSVSDGERDPLRAIVDLQNRTVSDVGS